MRLIDAQILQFMSKTIIIIPSRLSATRLPNKPLLKIGNLSIIQHVYKRAIESKVGKVYVATGDKEIANEILKIKGKFILTKKKHKTGNCIALSMFLQNKLHKNNIKSILIPASPFIPFTMFI